MNNVMTKIIYPKMDVINVFMNVKVFVIIAIMEFV
jgi:hypothetical protein